MSRAVLTEPKAEVHWIQEPLLSFANGSTHIDPKVGIAAHGPHSIGDARHPASVTAGFIGSAESVEVAGHWLDAASTGVDGGTDYTPFPGYHETSPFKARLRMDGPAEYLTQKELRPLLGDRVKRWAAFDELIASVDLKLRQLASRDSPPGLVFIALPAELLSRYRSVRKLERGVEITRNFAVSSRRARW